MVREIINIFEKGSKNGLDGKGHEDKGEWVGGALKLSMF